MRGQEVGCSARRRNRIKMNRKARRKVIKDIFDYRGLLKQASTDAVNSLEAAFKKKWEADDETLNDGDIEVIEDDGSDDIYNC